MISSHKLKKFVKHLCIVTRHYYGREEARRELKLHFKNKKSANDIELLNRKINLLLDKETKVAELGLNKNIPVSVQKKIRFLESQLALMGQERDQLLAENEELKEALDTLSNNAGTTEQVDRKYRQQLIRELSEKISLLESSYNKIVNDSSIHPGRLEGIKERIESYKSQLARFSA